MKDMMRIEIEVGQHVFYFCCSCGIVHEEAEVIKVRSKSIRIRFFGNRKKGQKIKQKGEESNIYNTVGRIFVLSKRPELERVAFLDQIKGLSEENDKLAAEVDKIHYRSDIIDL